MSEETETQETKKESTKTAPAKKTVTKKTTTKKAAAKKKEYPRKSCGEIDWQKLIPEEFFAPFDKSDTRPISELGDNEKMIKLAGFKFLLKERGFITKNDEIIATNFDGNNNYVVCKCTIEWAPHEDSNNVTQVYTACGDAVYSTVERKSTNVDSFMIKYLTAAAQNRAFVRAVREYLNIHVVGQDETDKATVIDLMSNIKPNSETNDLPQKVQDSLRNLVIARKGDLEYTKTWFRKNLNMDENEINQINDWRDIPQNACFALMVHLDELDKAKKEKEKES